MTRPSRSTKSSALERTSSISTSPSRRRKTTALETLLKPRQRALPRIIGCIRNVSYSRVVEERVPRVRVDPQIVRSANLGEQLLRVLDRDNRVHLSENAQQRRRNTRSSAGVRVSVKHHRSVKVVRIDELLEHQCAAQTKTQDPNLATRTLRAQPLACRRNITRVSALVGHQLRNR